MAIRNILTGENPRLRKTSRPVHKINNHILDVLDDMGQTMYDACGVGLAAPQVGVLRRLVVIDVGDGEGLRELINPEIIASDGQVRAEEGCLSFPNIRGGYVVRPEKVKVRALDREGNEQIIEGEGLLARALCHEIDHLDGVLYVDRVVEWITDDEDAEEYEGEVVQVGDERESMPPLMEEETRPTLTLAEDEEDSLFSEILDRIPTTESDPSATGSPVSETGADSNA